MRNKNLLALLVVGIFLILTLQASAQMVFNVGQSSEWEATAFNNGRRVVRDCSMFNIGYFHYVWHSQSNPANAPSGSNCDIYYACTDHNGMVMVPPTNLTAGLHFEDNRYPSIAIENDGLDNVGNWRLFNTIHLVWQVKETPNTPYEVYHGIIPVGNPPLPPAALNSVKKPFTNPGYRIPGSCCGRQPLRCQPCNRPAYPCGLAGRGCQRFSTLPGQRYLLHPQYRLRYEFLWSC